jgi:Kef-type K+ transport system membrane component KefB
MTFISMILVRLPFLFLLRYYKGNTVIPSLLVTTSTIIVAIAIEHISKESGLLDEKLAPIFIIISLITCLIPPILFANHNDFSEARLEQKDYIIELSDFDEIPSEHEQNDF